MDTDLDQVIDRDPSPSNRARFLFSCVNHLSDSDSLILGTEVETVAKEASAIRRSSSILHQSEPKVSGISGSPLSRGLQSADVSRSPLDEGGRMTGGFHLRPFLLQVFASIEPRVAEVRLFFFLFMIHSSQGSIVVFGGLLAPLSLSTSKESPPDQSRLVHRVMGKST